MWSYVHSTLTTPGRLIDGYQQIFTGVSHVFIHYKQSCDSPFMPPLLSAFSLLLYSSCLSCSSSSFPVTCILFPLPCKQLFCRQSKMNRRHTANPYASVQQDALSEDHFMAPDPFMAACQNIVLGNSHRTAQQNVLSVNPFIAAQQDIVTSDANPSQSYGYGSLSCYPYISLCPDQTQVDQNAALLSSTSAPVYIPECKSADMTDSKTKLPGSLRTPGMSNLSSCRPLQTIVLVDLRNRVITSRLVTR